MKGELQPHEAHPAAQDAMEYIRSIPISKLMIWMEAFSSCAIEGNRLGEVCAATLDRIMKGEPVSDRYLLGLAWALRGKVEARAGGIEIIDEGNPEGTVKAGCFGALCDHEK